MKTTHTCKLFVTAAVGAATALLFLGAGTAQAVPDVSEHGGLRDHRARANLKWTRNPPCPGSCVPSPTG